MESEYFWKAIIILAFATQLILVLKMQTDYETINYNFKVIEQHLNLNALEVLK